MLVSSSLEKLKASHAVAVSWRSYELRPADGPPISPEYRAKIEAYRPRVYEIAREQYGLEMSPGPFGINSRPALVGAKYAEVCGVGETYHATVFHSYWLDGRDISDAGVLKEIAISLGLDGDKFCEALAAETYQSAVLADIEQAFHYGLNGVPALVFENKYLVSGAQPYEVLTQVVEQIEAEDIG